MIKILLSCVFRTLKFSSTLYYSFMQTVIQIEWILVKIYILYVNPKQSMLLVMNSSHINMKRYNFNKTEVGYV